jgi:hypothetical protein
MRRYRPVTQTIHIPQNIIPELSVFVNRSGRFLCIFEIIKFILQNIETVNTY